MKKKTNQTRKKYQYISNEKRNNKILRWKSIKFGLLFVLNSYLLFLQKSQNTASSILAFTATVTWWRCFKEFLALFAYGSIFGRFLYHKRSVTHHRSVSWPFRLKILFLTTFSFLFHRARTLFLFGWHNARRNTAETEIGSEHWTVSLA